MAISLGKCVGCGACGLACKTENNTQYETNGRKYNWADYYSKTSGQFPDVSYQVYPVQCNHCTDAPCVDTCPVTPKAMFKTDDGITIHNDDRCIGCQRCVVACPYSNKDVIADDVQYSNISFNPSGVPTQDFYNDETSLIAGCISSPKETATLAGVIPPDKNEYTSDEYNAVRPSGVTEKCIFCDHRLKLGQNPYCVDSCPTGARVFGDLDDSNSEISQLLAANPNRRFENNMGDFLPQGESGTGPNVYYIGEFDSPFFISELFAKEIKKLLIYPNPVRSEATVEFDLDKDSPVSLSIYNVTGKEVRKVVMNETYLRGKNSLKMNVQGLSTGTYICSLRTNSGMMSGNIIVTR